MYLALKLAHITAAILTISGFALRGFWMLTDSANLDRRIVKIAPHIVDSVFLLSGIGLIWILRLPVMSQPWLMAKLLALVFYVLLGTVALRRGKTKRTRAIALLLAILTFAYIAGVAMNKSVGSWLSFVGS
ncbi:MAG: SirB2 family protein [Gammaproteobacteria bacterium]|nr:SirB2 family protein [Gammaproteobacteria bacterium]